MSLERNNGFSEYVKNLPTPIFFFQLNSIVHFNTHISNIKSLFNKVYDRLYFLNYISFICIK